LDEFQGESYFADHNKDNPKRKREIGEAKGKESLTKIRNSKKKQDTDTINKDDNKEANSDDNKKADKHKKVSKKKDKATKKEVGKAVRKIKAVKTLGAKKRKIKIDLSLVPEILENKDR